ncbi:CCR4-NOT transcription complex subunit 3-like isoform X3 [Mizuhopecten yessoensis]|uniref:CCR4-NOT transcription complex subunit 3-like isoform X3 n=1 Tax=Mizuhopecten yessoensis TaxID=6573 RepID=UPI000B45A6EC|nr:CCR4-NOT transcription complex subunit 3-like isoform X3 [Mizuhopecten yessoensis]
MADRRKLQGEIDRCLKKVGEGVETFEDIWNKISLQVHSAANTNQKEKYEADLKREIKKLQRLRDQIKTWCASSDIKDKRTLVENRKLIETQMERFKIVERETKTKAYSKEGLGAAAKMDPIAKEKGDVVNWLSTTIESLQKQLEQFESRIEQLSSKKKKMDKDTQDQYEELRAAQDRHKFHIKKLETIMRMVDNDALPLDQIKKIKDDVEYYVDSNQDPDFEENEFLYDDLDLDDLGSQVLASSPPNDDSILDKLSSTPTSTNSSSPSPSPSLSLNHSKDKYEELDRKRHKSQNEDKQKATSIVTSSMSSPSSTNSSSSSVTVNKVPTTPTKMFTGNSIANAESNHRPSSTPPLTAYNVAAAVSQQNNSAETKIQAPLDHINSTISSVPVTSNSTITNSVSSTGNPVLPAVPIPMISNSVMSSSPNTIVSNSATSSSLMTSFQQNSVSVKPEMQVVMNGPLSAVGPLLKGVTENDIESMSSLKSIAQQAVLDAGLENRIPTTHTTTLDARVHVPFNNTTSTSSQVAAPQPTSPSPSSSSDQSQQAQTTTIHLNPLLGVAPLGPVPLTREHYYQLTMLEAAYHHLPHPSDSERIRHYLPRNPCPTPSYYPQLSPPHTDSVDYFQRLSTESLFFIFYYMEGTKAQYLAAKALKKQSWRFHTKYMMWFQRHEEPKTITEDFEQGTYIYFDYEKWAQRKKEGFTFEYRYLEDRDLN